MATPGAPMAPQLPVNYLQHYMAQATTLDGHYGRFYSAFLSTTGNTADELFDAIVLSTQQVPKVLLARVGMANHTQQIITHHRPSMYKHDLVEPAPTWSNRAIAFLSDIHPHSRFIETTIFPGTAFNVMAVQTIPTMAAMDPLVQAAIKSTIGPFASGNPNTKGITTWSMMLVSPCYTNIVFGKTFTPCKLWQQLAVPIISNG